MRAAFREPRAVRFGEETVIIYPSYPKRCLPRTENKQRTPQTRRGLNRMMSRRYCIFDI